MQSKHIVLLFFFMFCLASCQEGGKKGRPSNQKAKVDQSFLMTIVNTILGGPYDAPIITRVMNKISHIATLLLGSVFAYFKWFRQRKNRRDKINEFIGDEKHKFAMIAEVQAKKIGEKIAQKIIYDLNSEKSRAIAIKSSNGAINFNIDIRVDQIIDESILIYIVSLTGNDPEGKSKFTGFVTFNDKLLEIRLEQTYEQGEKKKEESPICLFEGKQVKEGQNLVQGEWWIDGQRNTQGSYSGVWTFTY